MPAFHRFRLALVGFDPEALPAAVVQAPCVEGNMKAFFADATAAEVSRCVAAGYRGRTGRRRLDSAAPRGGAQRDPLGRVTAFLNAGATPRCGTGTGGPRALGDGERHAPV